MPFTNPLTMLLPSKRDGMGSFDYPEVFALLSIVIAIAIYLKFSPLAMALLLVIALPSVLILVYNYYRPTSFWTSSIVVVLLSTVIGMMQPYSAMALSLVLLIGSRVIVSKANKRLKLLMVAVVTAFIFYCVSRILNAEIIDYHSAPLTAIALIASMASVLWQFWQIYHQYMECRSASEQATKRLGTMVAVINKLTRFIPLQIWQPIVTTNTPVHVANKRAKLTIMFSDIVGFTDLSDSLSSDNLAPNKKRCSRFMMLPLSC